MIPDWGEIFSPRGRFSTGIHCLIFWLDGLLVEMSTMDDQRITLNVGGKLFETRRSTLAGMPSKLLHFFCFISSLNYFRLISLTNYAGRASSELEFVFAAS